MVVCAPTASGKTVLLEIAICRLFKAVSSRSTSRALYLAPLKALCAEKTAEWSMKFASAGLTCIEATGEDEADSSEMAVESLSKARIICATPEKWVALSRKPGSNTELLRSIDLVLIDECHMVGTSRGAFLELALLLVRWHNLQARLIAVSATIGNLGDISRWLSSYDTDSAQATPVPAKTVVFGDEYRSVPLSRVVIGYDCRQGYYKFQRYLDYRLPSIINTHCSGQSVIVFCSTRGSAQDLCHFFIHNLGQISAPPTPIQLTSL
ncbi:ATP-dependent DNA helicase MER3, partial [Coemansia erecta]